jgi:GDP-D-mannose dehydratase
LNKVSEHAKQWDPITNNAPLILGSIESFRNVLHAIDVAKAIELIINQPVAENYLICNECNVKIRDLVINIYFNNGLDIIEDKNTFYEKKSMLPIIQIEHKNNGLDNIMFNIDGFPDKLKRLHWSPTIKLDELLDH